MSEKERARALLLGLAMGDALGWPIQFLSMPKIRIIYGDQGIQELPTPAPFSDDTQMTIAVARALVEAGDQDIDALMKVFVRELLAWSNSPDNNRAAGLTVTEACRNLEMGISWRTSGDPHARGGGSVNRVAPIGFLYQHDPSRLRALTEATSLATHAHPTANAASLAAAYLVKLALDGVDPDEYLRRSMDFTDGISSEFDATMLRVGHVMPWTDEVSAMTHLGSGWVADEAVALSLYCAMRYPNDLLGALRRAVNHKGASDSVGCVTGGIMGARLGMAAIPAEWPPRLERYEELLALADQLAARKLAMYGASQDEA